MKSRDVEHVTSRANMMQRCWNQGQRQVSENLANEPTSAKVAKALGKLRNGKAAGTSNILLQMLQVGVKNEDFVCILTDLLSAVWEERCVPHEWVDAILIPIPKKGNLHCCDNWR